MIVFLFSGASAGLSCPIAGAVTRAGWLTRRYRCRGRVTAAVPSSPARRLAITVGSIHSPQFTQRHESTRLSSWTSGSRTSVPPGTMSPLQRGQVCCPSAPADADGTRCIRVVPPRSPSSPSSPSRRAPGGRVASNPWPHLSRNRATRCFISHFLLAVDSVIEVGSKVRSHPPRRSPLPAPYRHASTSHGMCWDITRPDVNFRGQVGCCCA